MTFERLVLHNFGPFLGRTSVDLAPPDKTHPLVLFGGLNGAGKTTILDALQLVLYGKNARCSNRNGRSYSEYLQACINRSVSASDGAALELKFRHFEEGKETTYQVHRSWAASDAGLREHFEVVRDGHPDPLHTESWDQSVEEFIPSRLSQLFFFDGEKIEALADLENSASLLQTAIQGLLGLDLIDHLSTDLVALRRRKRQTVSSVAELELAERIRAELVGLEENRRRLNDLAAAAQGEVDKLEKSLKGIDEEYQRRGGALHEQRGELENQRDFLEEQLSAAEERLREVAADATPLLLVAGLLAETEERGSEENRDREATLLTDALQQRDKWLLAEARHRRVPASALQVLARLLAVDRKNRESAGGGNRAHLSLSPESLATIRMLRGSRLGELLSLASRFLEEDERLRAALTELDRKVASMPAPDALVELLDWRARVRSDLHRAQAKFDHLRAEHGLAVGAAELKRRAYEAALDKDVHEELKRTDAQRVIEYADRVSETLRAFRTSVLARHIERIEQLVLDSFQQLLRKKGLVVRIAIDPKTFSVSLIGRDGRTLAPDRLSAGERQLLAVSLLWGLARASGRPLPTVIDTPLGRLDSDHRRHLIKRYFPSASHQVLLLSTDEEIDEKSYALLKPTVGREYRLEFDDTTQSTRLVVGYFWEGTTDAR